MNLRCVVLDDEPLAVELLRQYIMQSEGLELAHSGTDPFLAFKFLQENKVDLLFLDVQMPDLSGIQMLRMLHSTVPVVLTTAYEEYAITGFELDVVDYLLKPISYERFLQAVERVRKRLSINTIVTDSSPFLLVRSSYRLHKIPVSDIILLESFRDYVQVHYQYGSISTQKSLTSFQALLPAEKFMRIHKSFIVAHQHIEFLEHNRISIAGRMIPIGSTFRERFKKWYRIDT